MRNLYENWDKTASSKCEVIVGRCACEEFQFCGRTTIKVYPCGGGGWMSLCLAHGRKHTEAWPIQETDLKLT